MLKRLSKSSFMQTAGFYLTASAIFMIVMILLFTIFYHYIENLKWLDALYFTVITTRTIGFGDISPHTATGKIGTIFNALLPATIFLGASLVVLEKLFKGLEVFWRLYLMKHHKHHTIIVADIDLLESIVSEAEVDGQDFVIVGEKPKSELSPTLLNHISDLNYFEGDPTDDHTLKKVQVENAKQILIATSDDTTNLYVLVTAKSLNSHIKTIVRVNRKKTEMKFKAVGADYTLSTSNFLGRMFLQATVHPIAHQFLIKLQTGTEDPFLEEVTPGASFQGKKIREKFSHSVAVYRNGEYLYDIENERIRTGDIIVQLRTLLTNKNSG